MILYIYIIRKTQQTNGSVSESVSVLGNQDGLINRSASKRMSLDQRGSQIFSEKFKQNPDHDDIMKVGKATLAAILLLSKDDGVIKED